MIRALIAAALLSIALPVTPVLAEEFTLASEDISEGGTLDNSFVFQGFGCEGGNISPQLSWSGAPEGTKSFAVTAYDPDAPTGSGWWHWSVLNLPADAVALPRGASPEGALPDGAIELSNDYGAAGFGGACPPPGEVHRYIFTVYALGVDSLPVDASASNALAGFMTRANALASDSITAVYRR
ncbi:MAG: YbhB/YbcL family Raf kinase inhibitor-like protein [Rhodobacteraceae bacterium]|nr:YbhB/YbcL family Raf kinase inhibitor-like protein [Paracoccaceae bacterium]